MTLSSPEHPIAGFQVWEPAEVTAPSAQERFVPTAPAPTASALFEISQTAGIPDAVLNPARLAAQSAGYVAGWHRGREAGQLAVEAEAALIRAADERQAEAVRRQIAQAITALHDAAQEFDRRTGPSAEETEELILSAAFQLAEAIVGVSLADDQVRGRAALQRALAAAPKDVPVTVRLSPQDLAALEAAGLRTEESVTVVADPTLAPGDAHATTAGTRIDARISAALERARGVLRGELGMTTVVERIRHTVDAAATAGRPLACGQVDHVRGLSIAVRGISPRVGELIHIDAADAVVAAEVVAVQDGPDGHLATCLPLGSVAGIGAGDTAIATGRPLSIQVGEQLLGRVLDGLGRPLDGGRLPATMPRVGVDGTPPDALRRARIDTPLSLGVRVVDTLAPLGRGQRMGIFAGSGVGKSSLLSMMTRGTSADVTVVALIGERGREVREFLEDDLGPDGLRRAVLVVATSDQPPVVRMRAAYVATRIAEWFRDSGKHVLLMMDSLTRLAAAQREIGLSAGEPPTTRGYPPSVFATMPQLLERAGASDCGSITGLYTVLVEGDDHNEPVADTARSILDGHIVLDRRLANSGHFPAVDALQSLSRVAGAITDPEQRGRMHQARRLIAARQDVKELVEIGAYVAGTNPAADRALALWPAIEGFLQQDLHDLTPAAESWNRLSVVLGETP